MMNNKILERISFFKRFFFLAILLFLCLHSNAQEKWPFEYIQTLDYYSAYKSLINKEKVYKNTENEGYYWEAIGTIYCFFQKPKLADQTFLIGNRLRNGIVVPDDTFNTEQNIALDSVLKLSDNYNVVMLNEAHHNSSNRAFLYYLLPLLKERGFTQLAMEALNNEEYKDEGLEDRGYPIYNKTGIYTNDPVYSDVLRRALELGYTLISYESYNKEREKEEAENIYRKYDPKKGKLLVYAGYAHIKKSPEEKKMMGYYLKNLLKEDYLSLSQYIPKHFNYDSCVKDNAYVFAPDTSDGYDYFIIPPKEHSKTNIPGWYGLLDYKTTPILQVVSDSVKLPVLIQIFNENESKDAVPVYQYMIEKPEEWKGLLAYPKEGEYRVHVVSDEGENDFVKYL